jgi:hypothetical protein
LVDTFFTWFLERIAIRTDVDANPFLLLSHLQDLSGRTHGRTSWRHLWKSMSSWHQSLGTTNLPATNERRILKIVIEKRKG